MGEKRLKRILFVCVGNTCRSQMAEGFAKKYGGGRIEARSAGTCAMGVVNRTTAESMLEAGVDISAHTSKQLSREMFEWADVVVTMGCARAEDICPPSYSGEKIDWKIEDPLGRGPEVMERVRDDIEKKVRGLVGE